MYYDDNTLVYLDGAIMPVKDAKCGLFSQTMHYGVGVFEGIRAFPTPDGPRMFKSRAHFDRLVYSANRMHLSVGIDYDTFKSICYELVAKNNLAEAYIRPLVFAAPQMSLSVSNGSHLFIAAWKWGKLLGDKVLSLMFSSYKKPSSDSFHIDAKVCGNYVNNVLATTEAKSKGYDDGILLDEKGNVLCTAGANIFMEKDETLYTPTRGKIFPGITRDVIINIAKEVNIPVREKELTPKDLREADSIFLTGTATDVAPVGKIEKKECKLDWEESIGYVLSRKYQQLVTRRHQSFPTFI